MLRQLSSVVRRSRSQLAAGGQVAAAPLAVRSFSKVVDNLKYAKSHEWVKVDGDVGTIGITDHAQSELGDVVYVELPAVGSALTAGKTFGVVESVKAASDVYSPVSGTVLETNSALVESPALVNSSPFGEAWMMKVKLTSPGDVAKLLDAKAYAAHCEADAH